MHYETYYVRTCQHIMYSKKIHQFEGTSLNFNLLRSIFITSTIEMHMPLYSVLLQKNLIECVLSIGLYFRIIIKINNYILFSVYI